MNGIEMPSTPNVNLRLSLLNQLKELTNWKCGISLLKFRGRYNDSKKLLTDVQIADFFDWIEFSSFSEDKRMKRSPISGRQIRIGNIGKLIIKIYSERPHLLKKDFSA